jgi:hypothetical protein
MLDRDKPRVRADRVVDALEDEIEQARHRSTERLEHDDKRGFAEEMGKVVALEKAIRIVGVLKYPQDESV